MSIAVRERLGADDVAAVQALVAAAAAADGVQPLSEQVRLDLRYGGDPAARSLLLWQQDELAGFAHLGPADPAQGPSGELVVHPVHRRQGVGSQLAGAAVGQAAGLPVRIWAHGDLPAAAGLAKATGFGRIRGLWQMLRSFAAGVPELPPLPAGITLRTFVPGRDEAPWLALNGRAFAGHPEQGRWTPEDLAHREREPWFDPAGFFLAERDGHAVGFHWTKIHRPEARESPDGSPDAPRPSGDRTYPLGEVYVLGVDPTEQGTGLGKVLTIAGLQHLATRGVPAVMLYVDDKNLPAIHLYQRFGFTHTATDVMYQRP